MLRFWHHNVFLQVYLNSISGRDNRLDGAYFRQLFMNDLKKKNKKKIIKIANRLRFFDFLNKFYLVELNFSGEFKLYWI